MGNGDGELCGIGYRDQGQRWPQQLARLGLPVLMLRPAAPWSWCLSQLRLRGFGTAGAKRRGHKAAEVVRFCSFLQCCCPLHNGKPTVPGSAASVNPGWQLREGECPSQA